MQPGEHVEQQPQQQTQSTHVRVPLTGSSVIGQDAGQGGTPEVWREGIYRPATTTRNERSRHMAENGMGRSIARSMERRAQAEAPTPTPVPAPTPAPSADYTAMQQEIAALRQQVASFTQNPQPQYADGVIGDLQRRTAEMPPYGLDYGDPYPTSYDPFDQASVDAYIKQESQKAVDADRQARQLASDEERYRADIAATEKKYGRDANFEEIRAQAAQIVIATGGRILLEEAYKAVSDDMEARSGRRGSTRLPTELRGGKSWNSLRLGAITRYNQETGRAGRRR